MGRYFDFQQVKPWSGGLGSIGEGLGEIGDIRNENEKRRLAKEKQAADIEVERQKAASYAAQVDATNRGGKSRDLRDQVTFDQGQQDRLAAITKNIAGAASGGRYGEAAALAAGSQFMDPRTGKMAGIGFEVNGPGPEPVAPQAPVAPAPRPMPTEPATGTYDVQETPDQARARAMARAQGIPENSTQPPAAGAAPNPLATLEGDVAARRVQDIEAERAKYTKDQARYQAEKTAVGQQTAADQKAFAGQSLDYDINREKFAGDQQDYAERQKHPSVSLTYPTGKSVTINPQEQKEYEAAESGKTAAQLRRQASAPGLDPAVAAQMLRVADTIEAGLKGADKAPITGAQAQATGNVAKSDLQGKQIESTEKIQGGHDRAKIIAAGLTGKKKGGSDDLPEANDQRVLTEIKEGLNETTRKGGLEEQVQHLGSTLRQLEQQPNNPVLMTNAIDAAIRTNTGRAAIKAQYDLYRAHAGGTAAKFDDWLEGVKSGGIGAESTGNFMSAFKSAYNELRGATKAEYDKVAKYRDDPRVKNHKAIKLGLEGQLRNAFSSDPGQQPPEQQAAPANAHPKNDPLDTVRKGPDGIMRKKTAAGWVPVQ